VVDYFEKNAMEGEIIMADLFSKQYEQAQAKITPLRPSNNVTGSLRIFKSKKSKNILDIQLRLWYHYHYEFGECCKNHDAE
jgi:hypothetical protein